MLAKIRTHLNIIVVAGITTLFISCNNAAETIEQTPEATTPVTIVLPAFKQVNSSINLPAISKFMNNSIIRATTTGIIENISASPGDFISAGQLLFRIRTRESMALKKTNETDSALTFNGLINVSSQTEGVISSVAYQKNDYVQEGDELAVISEQKSLVFILEVPYEIAQYMGKNRNCTLILPDNKEIKGTVSGKLPEMDMQSQTLGYIIKPSNAGKLPANLIASARIIKSTSENAMVLPKNAVLGDETQTEFWVMKLINDSTAVKVLVSKGFENTYEVEITDPKFLENDRIILTGNYGLPDTARIEVIKE